MCRNFIEGYVFSGDTAQTVARGVDFRFEDIRSLFYNEFFLESENKRRISDTFHLNQNFRTHAGFLKLSQSYNWVRSRTCYFSSDDSSKKEIYSHIGKKALILTIVESKGLELLGLIFVICFFDFVTNFLTCMHDVLLYNFFGTSPLKKNWRLVYGYMKEKNLLDSTNIKSFPCFSEGKHKILCSELRQLYVAITRTKQRLWVYENIGEFSNHIFDYWKKLQVVLVKTLDESLAHEMRVTSSNTDWSLRGIKAAGLRASADSMWGSKSESARVALSESASIYKAIGKFELAAKYLIHSMEYKRAGMKYLLFSHQNSKVFISTSTFI
ncbi:hypothetical protein MKX01_024557 [Papaver californicum]|nr:hypothetical protein MKX01_024557 [Papaver californicum]